MCVRACVRVCVIECVVNQAGHKEIVLNTGWLCTCSNIDSCLTIES